MEEKSLWDRGEQFAKVAAGFGLAVYVFGFLITALYYSTLGVGLINPLRPRIIGSGLLFAATVIMGYWAGVHAFSDFLTSGPDSGKNQFQRFLMDCTLLVLICTLLSTTLWQMTDFSSTGLIAMLNLEIAPVILYTAGITIWRIESLSLKARTWVTCSAMGLALTDFTVSFVWLSRTTTAPLLIGWLIFVAGTIHGTAAMRNAKNFAGAMNITSFVSQAVLLLVFFSHSLYPHFVPAWGGGSPVPVTITYSKDANYLAGLVKPSLLLDESDVGYYLVDRNLKRTYFVPRGAVALLVFEQKSDMQHR